MLLEIKNLSVAYGPFRALNHVSLNINESECVCIIGANGAGKTTILNTVSGIVPVCSGEIRYKKERIDHLSAQDIVKQKIIQIPEGRRIFPELSVEENLTVGAYLRKDKEKIQTDREAVFQHFPILKKRTRQKGGSLSGGEQQMLAVGRALMADPKLLMMDEPTIGLSPKVSHVVSDTIVKIKKQGVGIILVEQNAHMALNISDNGYVLEMGEIVLKGPCNDLMNHEHLKKAYLGG